MNYKYVLTKTTYYNGEHTRTSYGIAVISGEDMLRLVGVQPIFNASDNVELTKRGEYVIAIEIENQEGMIELPETYRDILTDKIYSGKITIGAFSVMVLKKEA